MQTPIGKDVDVVAEEKNEKKELIRFAFWAVLIVLPIRLFIAQPFIVEGASMVPSFSTGEYLIVDELSFYTREITRGEVIIFKYPKDPKRYYIKRVIGLPGETVSGENQTITIKNAEHPLGVVLNEPYVENHSLYSFNRTLGENEYFVMGDNRPASSDSRAWGTVPREM